MTDKFTEREKSFEKKFAKDEELQFKIQARSNKYLAEFICLKLGKNDEERKYIYKKSLKQIWKKLEQRMYTEK